MARRESQGLGGLGSLVSTNDLSGTVSDVTNGNPIGSTYKNGAGLVVAVGAADNEFVLSAAASTIPIGVLGDTPKAGMPGQIDSAEGTITKVLTGAAVTRGVRAVADSNGRSINYASGAAYSHGIFLESASAANVIVSLLLKGTFIPS